MEKEYIWFKEKSEINTSCALQGFMLIKNREYAKPFSAYGDIVLFGDIFTVNESGIVLFDNDRTFFSVDYLLDHYDSWEGTEEQWSIINDKQNLKDGGKFMLRHLNSSSQ